MTQTTAAQTFFEAMVEYNISGGAWTDFSGWGCSVAVSGGERQVGDAYTFDGDTAIIGIGKQQPYTVTVRAVYTEAAPDPYNILLAAFQAHNVVRVRWSPWGGDLGEKRYTTHAQYSYITAMLPPQGEAGSGDPITFEFTVYTSNITQDTETT
jgi:hypothetical protein